MKKTNGRTKNGTKNDVAWEFLFEKYGILEQVARHGRFEIDSAQINQVRESRLMAKFDHYVNLPEIFRNHKLSILPVSRYKYVIGNFDTHHKLKYDSEIEPRPVDFPENIISINPTNLYSENSALSCAFNTGIIDDLVNEQAFYTVSGRMSTDEFEFKINNTVNGTDFIKVNNAQCEVDAGFESANYFLLIEAKNYLIDDFLIRQLYYPYRLWSRKISKRVVPILMTYSNDMFSFFIFNFENELEYNSLALVQQKNYVLGSEQIQLSDVSKVFGELNLVAEPTDVPFPQADKFERVVDLISLLVEKDLTKDEITENYQFDARQTNYYTDAGRYIGLVDKYKNNTKEVTFCLTDQGKSILRKRHKIKYLELIKKILEHGVFYTIFELAVKNGEIPSKDEVCKVMSASGLSINEQTIERRSRTVRKWIEWVWSQIE